MTAPMTTSQFIEKFTSCVEVLEKTNEAQSGDLALNRLMIAFKDKLVAKNLLEQDITGHWFSKSFRADTITEVAGGHVDMSIWYLIAGSELFWNVINDNVKSQAKKD